MEFSIQRELFLKVLQPIVGVVEKRQSQPILGNVLLSVAGQQLSLTATDLEVELVGYVDIHDSTVSGDVTVPARKLLDICKNQPENTRINFCLDKNKAILRTKRGRYSLSTLPATEYPNVEDSLGLLEFSMAQKDLRFLIERTHFAMAHQDVRYYLNGILLDVEKNHIRCVATDGHRLAFSSVALGNDYEKHQVIIPRKGIMELLRLIQDSDEKVSITLSRNHILLRMNDFLFRSKLIDGRFPEFEKVIPKRCDKKFTIDRDVIRDALVRVSVLCNEKFKGVHLQLKGGQVKLCASNPEHEEAEEFVELTGYDGEDLEIGFNVKYLLEVLNTLAPGEVRFSMVDPSSSILLEEVSGIPCRYVIMPMRL